MKNELETLGDLLTEFQLVKVLLTGTSSEQGLLQRVAESRPVIECLVEILDQMRKVSEQDTQAVATLAARADGMVQTFDIFEQRVKTLIQDSVSEAFISEQGRRILSAATEELSSHAMRETMKMVSRDIAKSLEGEAKEVSQAVLQGHGVNSALQLSIELETTKLRSAREIETAAHQASIEVEKARAREAIAKEELKHERKMNSREKFQWAIAGLAIGGIAAWILQPLTPIISPLIKSI